MGVRVSSPRKQGDFLEKQAFLMSLDHIPHVFRFVQSSIYKQSKSTTRLKSRTLGLNFVRDMALIGRSKVQCILQYFNSK